MVGKAGELGINPRRGTAGRFSNFVVVDFDKCLDVDSSSTFNVMQNGELTMENTVLSCNTDIVENDEDTADPFSVIAWFDGQPGNTRGMDPMLDGVFLPQGSPYAVGYDLDTMVYDDFFDDVDYIGAFRSRSSAWIWNWKT